MHSQTQKSHTLLMNEIIQTCHDYIREFVR